MKNLQNHEEAIRYYKEAIATDPNDASAYDSMGLAFYYLKNYDEAIRCYEKAIAIDSDDVIAYGNMATDYFF
jgi:superkiller protein 3